MKEIQLTALLRQQIAKTFQGNDLRGHKAEGVLNSHYWVDPKKDIAAVIMTQTLPFAKKPFMDTYDRFERAVYASL